MTNRTLAAVGLVLLIGVCGTAAHPAYQQQFNNIVNQNPCLKECFDQSTESGNELNILKTANATKYLLNSDEICGTISAAKKCIDACNYNSNPFDLEAMNAICRPISGAEIRVITPCLVEHGYRAADECQASCGDFETINRAISDLSSQYRSEASDADKVAEVMKKIGKSCNVIKCSNRCTMKRLGERCNALADGRHPADIFRALIERVLIAQRSDLDRMQLAGAMAKSFPPQCGYMHMPDAMFNVAHDEQVLQAIIRQQQVKGGDTATMLSSDDGSMTTNPSSLLQAQAQLMHKQMELLALEEMNLKREAKKLDVELKLALQKRALMRTADERNDAAAQMML